MTHLFYRVWLVIVVFLQVKKNSTANLILQKNDGVGGEWGARVTDLSTYIQSDSNENSLTP